MARQKKLKKLLSSDWAENLAESKNRSAVQTCVAYELPRSKRFLDTDRLIFLPLGGSGSLIACREKSRKTSGTGGCGRVF